MSPPPPSIFSVISMISHSLGSGLDHVLILLGLTIPFVPLAVINP
jgi:hypothetical protein